MYTAQVGWEGIGVNKYILVEGGKGRKVFFIFNPSIHSILLFFSLSVCGFSGNKNEIEGNKYIQNRSKDNQKKNFLFNF